MASGVNVIGLVFVLISAGLCLLALHAHATEFERLVSVLRRQQMSPSRLAVPLAASLVALETLVPLAVVISVLRPGALPGRVTYIIVAVAYAAFALYSSALLYRRPGVPCGCGQSEAPVNGWVPLRAGFLSAASTAGALTVQATWPSMSAAEWTLVLVAAAVSAVLLWIVPESLHVPGGRTPEGEFVILR